MRDGRTAGNDAVAVVGLNPVVVLDLQRLRVLAADPQHPTAAEQRQHVQVVLVLGVDRPLRMRRQIAQRQLNPTGPVLGALVAEDRAVMQRRAVYRQTFAQFEHPLMVEVEVHPPGQGVPGLLTLDVGRKRRVATSV